MSRDDHTTEPTAAEIAALTARLRELSKAGVAADAGERAQFLADKDALIERIIATDRTPGRAIWSGDEWADYRTYTRDEAAVELVARGVPPDQAPVVVERYLDGLSWERGWSPQDQWEIDDDDLAVMLTPPVAEHDDPGLTGAEGPTIDAGPTLTAEEAAHELAADGRSLDEARALVRGYLDDVSAQVGARVDLWGLDAADLAEIRTSPDPEAERRAELARWHADDQAHQSVDEHVMEDSP